MVMRATSAFEMLDAGEIEQINQTSMQVLERIGVDVHLQELRAVLAQRGARVEGERVSLPEPLVREALEAAPESITLLDLSGRELPAGRGQRVWAIGSAQYPTTLDVDGTRRPTTPGDAANLTRLMDALPRFGAIHTVEGPLVGVNDRLANLRSIAIYFANTSKHALISPARMVDAYVWFDLAEHCSQSGDLVQEPVLSVAVSTTSPLQVEPETARLLLESCRRGLPIVALPAPMAGATTPFTLAGTLMQMNAEALFLITAAQCVREGCPCFYGGVGAIMNMQSGRISMGSPEMPMMAIAHGQIGASHGLPTYHPLNQTDATRVDVQAGGEWVLHQVCSLASSLNYILIGAVVDNSLTTSPEALILIDDFLHVVERVFQGITVTPDTLAYDAVSRVGPGGHYMSDEHTLRFLRSGEHLYGSSFERGGSWEEGDAALCRAHDRVQTILAGHSPGVPDRTMQEIERYVTKKSKELTRRTDA
jgi:trimethylamine--corrinoid protein Co-methyltransferase